MGLRNDLDSGENRVLSHQIREQGETKLIYPPKTLRNTVCGVGTS